MNKLSGRGWGEKKAGRKEERRGGGGGGGGFWPFLGSGPLGSLSTGCFYLFVAYAITPFLDNLVKKMYMCTEDTHKSIHFYSIL